MGTAQRAPLVAGNIRRPHMFRGYPAIVCPLIPAPDAFHAQAAAESGGRNRCRSRLVAAGLPAGLRHRGSATCLTAVGVHQERLRRNRFSRRQPRSVENPAVFTVEKIHFVMNKLRPEPLTTAPAVRGHHLYAAYSTVTFWTPRIERRKSSIDCIEDNIPVALLCSSIDTFLPSVRVILSA